MYWLTLFFSIIIAFFVRPLTFFQLSALSFLMQKEESWEIRLRKCFALSLALIASYIFPVVLLPLFIRSDLELDFFFRFFPFLAYSFGIFRINSYFSSTKVAFSEFFSDDAVRFVKSYLRGLLTPLSLQIVLGCIISFFLSVPIAAVVPIFYVSPFFMFYSSIIIAIQSHLEELLFRDVIHRTLHKLLEVFDINTAYKRFIVIGISAFLFAAIHLPVPSVEVVFSGIYFVLLARYLPMAISWGWMYESELPESRKEVEQLDKTVAEPKLEGIGVTSAMHAFNNCLVIWTNPGWLENGRMVASLGSTASVAPGELMIHFLVLTVRTFFSIAWYETTKVSYVRIIDDCAVKATALLKGSYDCVSAFSKEVHAACYVKEEADDKVVSKLLDSLV